MESSEQWIVSRTLISAWEKKIKFIIKYHSWIVMTTVSYSVTLKSLMLDIVFHSTWKSQQKKKEKPKLIQTSNARNIILNVSLSGFKIVKFIFTKNAKVFNWKTLLIRDTSYRITNCKANQFGLVDWNLAKYCH